MRLKLFKSKWTSEYIFALSIVALLFISTYIIVQYTIATEKSSSFLINTSGKQRMLSKEIALKSIQLVNDDSRSSREKLRTDILAAAHQMELVHKQLITSDLTSIRSIYFGPATSLDYQVFRYTNEAAILAQLPDNELTNDDPHYKYILDESSDNFVDLLDSVVKQFQQESERKILLLQRIETYSLIIALLVLLSEALYIFRPMVKTIEKEKNELIEINRELERVCFMDGLTKVANRRYFDEYMQQEWNRSVREKMPLSLIMIDIDQFKMYNDTYGHLVGDDCLKQVARKLGDIIKRPTDLVARYGGEEFAVIIPNSDLDGARHVAEELRTGIEQLKIPHANSSVSEFVTVSLGVSTDGPEKYNGISFLISNADEALYKAKHLGRNNVQLGS